MPIYTQNIVKGFVLGLFDKLTGNSDGNKNINKQDDFVSVVIDTQNIAEELKNIASTHNINQKKLSFRILKVTTAYKTEKGGDYKEISEKDKELFNDNDFLLNPELKIKQHLKVEIFKKDETENENEIIPEIVLSGNKSLTKIVATVKKNLDVKYHTKLEKNIIDDINMKKVRSNILVGIRDENMYKEVKKVVAAIRVKNILDEDYIFVVCQGLDKVATIDDKLIFHYKNKIKYKDKQDRVDYSRRGFVLAVSKDETVIEYIKPRAGIPGKNCQGRFLSVKEPIVANEAILNHTENIIKKEDDNKILYVANKNGYIKIENGSYDIQENMEIESVDFKSTGSIETDINADVKINIKENDMLKDAIGTGMSVETSELHVEGNIGSGAFVKAKIVDIKGQIHKTAVIDADNIKIAVHRGEAIGKEIEIDRLEGGTVKGEIVRIRNVIGGEVTAKEIYIDELTSNSILRASSLIELQKVRGSNNKLIIDPTSTRKYNEKTEEINKKIKKINIDLKPTPKLLENKKRLIDNNRGVIEEIKKKILELKQDGKVPPSSLLGKIKEFQKMVSEYNDVLSNFKNEKNKLSTLKDDLNSVQNQIFSAKIINHGVWKEFNEIKFILITPSVEITYNTKNNEIIRELTIKQMEDEKFEIQRSSEYSKI